MRIRYEMNHYALALLILSFWLLWVSCFEIKVNGVIRLVVKVSAGL